VRRQAHDREDGDLPEIEGQGAGDGYRAVDVEEEGGDEDQGRLSRRPRRPMAGERRRERRERTPLQPRRATARVTGTRIFARNQVVPTADFAPRRAASVARFGPGLVSLSIVRRI